MLWLMILTGYLLGAIPTSYIAGRLLQGRDIRRLGDENAGAANVFREIGHRAGIVVGIIDALKGAVAVIIAQAFHQTQVVVMLAGAAAVIGHNWPVFTGFRGGRGVSTTIGILFVLVTLPMLILTLPVLLVLIVKRNVTSACAFLFIALPLVAWWVRVPIALIIYGIALPALVGVTTFLRNRSRVARTA